MTANPLKAWLADQSEHSRQMTAQAHCDAGNEHLAEIGRSDVHWIIRDGRPHIEWRHPPQGNLGR